MATSLQAPQCWGCRIHKIAESSLTINDQKYFCAAGLSFVLSHLFMCAIPLWPVIQISALDFLIAIGQHTNFCASSFACASS